MKNRIIPSLGVALYRLVRRLYHRQAAAHHRAEFLWLSRQWKLGKQYHWDKMNYHLDRLVELSAPNK